MSSHSKVESGLRRCTMGQGLPSSRTDGSNCSLRYIKGRCFAACIMDVWNECVVDTSNLQTAVRNSYHSFYSRSPSPNASDSHWKGDVDDLGIPGEKEYHGTSPKIYFSDTTYQLQIQVRELRHTIQYHTIQCKSIRPPCGYSTIQYKHEPKQCDTV